MGSDSPEKESLASTAYWIATARAYESKRADRLFDDPWAALLVSQTGLNRLDRIVQLEDQLERIGQDHKLSMHWGKPGQVWGHPKIRYEMNILEKPARASTSDQEALNEIGIVIRTKFFDDFLLRATREHQVRQVVILASGMDTRAFRLTWPAHTRLFEIDQSELLLQKRQILASVGASATCKHRSINGDLVAGSWPRDLIQAGFNPQQASVWLIEGLLPFLSESAVLALLDRVAALSAPGSYLGLNAVNSDMLNSPITQSALKSMKRAGIPWLSAIDDPEVFLAKRRWSAKIVQLGEEGANFGRWPYPVIPRSVPNIPRSWLVTAMKGFARQMTDLLSSGR